MSVLSVVTALAKKKLLQVFTEQPRSVLDEQLIISFLLHLALFPGMTQLLVIIQSVRTDLFTAHLE